ncbi:MAG: L-2-amino-thiazoline-4-carboxylic acid hydrolase [Oligoflexia bacterium]|nr:L-2-amino-thiazoline-4-carboxylic acid hydrolase [Oligoflexia bacterium]
MKVEDLRNYGVAFSDSESAWPPAVKNTMRRQAKAVLMARLGPWETLRFGIAFLVARRRAARTDLSEIRARGMRNETFLAQQIEYICVFSALARVLDVDRALAIMNAVMDETALEPMLLCLPDPDVVRRFPDALDVFREYYRVAPQAAHRAGCNELVFVEDDAQDSQGAFQFKVTRCVWLDLARALAMPQACLPNCYSDDLVFPNYFKALGIRYTRQGTLAQGAECCDFCFERARP